ncbi:MAG: AsmA family protein [Oceanicaulis sp.]
MRRILIVFLVLAFVLIGVALVLPSLISDTVLRERAERAASEALGREVVLAGDIGLRLLPRAEITARDARVANAEGFSAEPFAQMNELRLAVQLGPLLSRNVVIDEFVLVDPVIRLESRGAANNWTLGAPSDGAAPATGSEEGFLRRPGALPFEASFGDVRIENGTVLYTADGQDRRIEGLDVALSMTSVDAPIAIEGAFDADGFPMRFEAGLGSLRGFFEGAETPVTIELVGALADISFDGRFLESETLDFSGRADIALPLRPLGRYLGADLPEGEVFRTFTARAAVAGAPGVLRLDGAQVRLDDLEAAGDLVLRHDRVRPLITGALRTPMLDVTPYIPADSAAGSSGNEGVSEWSDERIDFSPLRTIDADLDIAAARFKARDIEARDIDIDLTLQNGRLTADMSRFSLYEGAGRVLARLDASRDTPSFALDARIDALDALPFLEAAAGFDRLRGIGAVNLDLTANGASPAAIMQSLSGEGAFSFADGALVGVNLAQVIRTVQQAVETGSLPSGFADSAETDFTALTGTVAIRNGVAQNPDLSMLSPLLRVQGQGAVNLAEQRIDYRLTPRAVSSITGQGGDLNLQGLAVPVRLQGGFNDVSVSIDFEQVARDLLRARAGDLIGGDVGRALGEGRSLEEAAGDALLNALGGNRNEEETAEDQNPAQRLLRGLLDRRRERPSEEPQQDGEGEGGGGG